MSGSLSFYSDNSSGAHPEVLQAIEAANRGHALGYGEDEHTRRAEAAFARHFGDDAQVLSVVNGSAANVVAAAACCRPYEAVITTSYAHLAWAECGAIERLVGCKVIEVPHEHGKIDLDAVRRLVGADADVHTSRPRLISITQATEVVTVYTPSEIADIAELAHAHGLLLHVDGARIANAAVSLGMGLRECTRDLGVDLLSFGGTKNGLLMGEAVIAFTPLVHPEYVRKQALQLLSKMRFVSAQFTALLEGDLWHRNAAHANAMAAHLAAPPARRDRRGDPAPGRSQRRLRAAEPRADRGDHRPLPLLRVRQGSGRRAPDDHVGHDQGVHRRLRRRRPGRGRNRRMMGVCAP